MWNANRILLILLGLLLLGGLAWYGYWFATHFEQRSKLERAEISPEARKNRLLAAEHFLQRSGQNAQSHAGRDIFALQPSTEDTIVLGSHSRLFLQRNHAALLAWINAGGHLLFVPEIAGAEGEDEFPLLTQLGVEHVSSLEDLPLTQRNGDATGQCKPNSADNHTEGQNDDREISAEPLFGNGATDDDDAEETVIVTFGTEHPGEYQARFNADSYLYDADDKAEFGISLNGHPYLLRYSLGSGSVTVLSDIELFSNDAIGQYDHAYLLHQLVRSHGKVWLLYSANMPSLLALLWQHAPHLLLIGVALLLMAGWRMLLRSGPLLKPRFEARRNLLEHLDASAEYSWRIDKARQLLTDNRNAIEQAWRRRHPRLNTLEQAERCTWIGEKSGITTRAIECTLYGDIASEQDFIKASAVLQRLAIRVKQPMQGAE